MVNRKHESQKLTYRVDLPGGQERLRELILYVSAKSADMKRFGLIKLNKIIWKADFAAFLARGLPVTGRAYQRLRFGPAPIEMQPLLAEMAQDQLIRFERIDFGKDAEGHEIIETRTIALDQPTLRWFSPDDLAFVDQAIDYYRSMTGTETSDDSHGMAWSSRSDADPMPYESAYLSDKELGQEQLARILERAQEQGWRSQ
jgi:hypothetical protein